MFVKVGEGRAPWTSSCLGNHCTAARTSPDNLSILHWWGLNPEGIKSLFNRLARGGRTDGRMDVRGLSINCILGWSRCWPGRDRVQDHPCSGSVWRWILSTQCQDYFRKLNPPAHPWAAANQLCHQVWERTRTKSTSQQREGSLLFIWDSFRHLRPDKGHVCDLDNVSVRCFHYERITWLK